MMYVLSLAVQPMTASSNFLWQVARASPFTPQACPVIWHSPSLMNINPYTPFVLTMRYKTSEMENIEAVDK